MQTKLFLFLVGFWVSGLLPAGGMPVVRGEETLIVSAPASLTNALKEAGRTFEKSRPGIRIVLNFAASGSLVQQMIHGAPVDIFASADSHFMNQAAAKGLIQSATRRDFARNSLVLATPLQSQATVKGLSDLGRPEVKRIALGNPETVPAGRYARQALESGNLWRELGSKLIFGNSVRQVLDYVRRGEVDAGLVYFTDVHSAGENIRLVERLEGHDPILYPIAVTASCRKGEAAGWFIAFLLGEEGRTVLARFGFQSP